jgi:hypothetical protein
MSDFTDLWTFVFQDTGTGQAQQVRADTQVDLHATHERIQALNQRIDRLELLSTALVEYLRVKIDLSEPELRQLVVRLDLADGREDGRIRPEVVAKCSRCAECGNPVNPKRTECVYCGAEIPEKAAASPPPSRTVPCRLCETVFEERDGFFSEHGLVCPRCFQDPGTAIHAREGGLSLTEAGSDGALSLERDAGALGLAEE